jgi:structural maintenance of chromosome 2
MWVEEISIEGFKSYARRAVLSGLDPAFNAVTGLNGSGKSNVLDAICFVLGISNLEQVRASSLQELVYKQGQAGVSRASVSITFNNSDSRRSPVGYEHCERISVSRQVVIGGRSTYRINGKKVQPKDVQELFHSVQLNVNNPHFLIMQGRIQKVLSMKPPEILSLLEEAAGTRMYEKKKDSALKTLHKKQAKVDEVDQVLQHEIYPALDRLRKEKEEHDRWCILGDRIKRLNRFVVAHEYTRAKADASEKHSSHSQLLETLRDAKSRENSLQHRTQELREQVNARKAEREQQLGNNFSQLKKQEDELSKELVQATASWQNKQDSLDSERKEVQRLHDSQQQLAEAASQKSKQEERLQQEYDHAAFEHKQLVDAADHAERAVHGMQTGKGTGDSQSLTEQLNEAKSTVNSSTVEADAAEKKAEQLQSDVLAKREQLERKRTEADNVTRQLEGLKDEAQKAKASLDNHEHDPGCAEEAHRERKRLQSEVESLRSNVDSINGQLSSLEFSFEDPERNFDRSRVKGALGKLVSVHDASESTALEVVAGGKLYQIVVDTDETGKKILQHGQLKKRVTLVPLNKVQANELKPSVIQHASAMSEGKASPAIESVSFDEKFRNAMIYAFGTSFICRDNETAKVVAYNKQSKAVCVTLEGDLHNPAGLLTGGSRGKKSSVLAKVQDLKNAQAELQQKRKVCILHPGFLHCGKMRSDLAMAKNCNAPVECCRSSRRLKRTARCTIRKQKNLQSLSDSKNSNSRNLSLLSNACNTLRRASSWSHSRGSRTSYWRRAKLCRLHIRSMKMRRNEYKSSKIRLQSMRTIVKESINEHAKMQNRSARMKKRDEKMWTRRAESLHPLRLSENPQSRMSVKLKNDCHKHKSE